MYNNNQLTEQFIMAANGDASKLTFRVDIEGVIKGYHAFKVRPILGEELQSRREPQNGYDSHTVAV